MVPDPLPAPDSIAYSRAVEEASGHQHGEEPDLTADLPPSRKPGGGSRRPIALRIAVALTAGVVVLLAILTSTGLLTGHPVGAADNGDGSRLYCGAGLAPATPDGRSNWQGAVVLLFHRVSPCAEPIPSPAGTILRAAVHGTSNPWSLTHLGWLYAALAAAAFSVATWAATRTGLLKALVLVPPVLPLADKDFSRFFVSTFSEPAGLLGAFVLVCGAVVVWINGRAHRLERTAGLVLVAGGGLLAATAKTAYVPLLGVAVLICAMTAVQVRRGERHWYDRLGPSVLALLTVFLAVGPLTTAAAWQARHYPAINAHNLIYTTVLTEVPNATAVLGLPPAAASPRYAGEAYYPGEGKGVPGADVVASAPGAEQKLAWHVLADHPAALLNAVGIAMQATEGRALTYLPSVAWTPGTPLPASALAGEQGATGPSLRAWLDGMSTPWLPSLLAMLGIAAGIAGAARRRSTWSLFARVAGMAGLSSVLLAVVAVLGDGYFEIAKHVWLAAYLLDVTTFALAGLVVSVIVQRYSRRARGRAA